MRGGDGGKLEQQQQKQKVRSGGSNLEYLTVLSGLDRYKAHPSVVAVADRDGQAARGAELEFLFSLPSFIGRNSDCVVGIASE